MSEPARPIHMTADEFLAWSLDRPEGEHWELANGQLIPKASERVAHARAKLRITEGLLAAVRNSGLPCEVYLDGMAVRVNEDTIYEPDAMVRCGPPLPDDALVVTDPIVLVEVVSPSSSGRDTGIKLADYMRIPTVRDYLIVRTEDRTAIHHARTRDGTIVTRIVRNDDVVLQAGFTLRGMFAEG